MTAAAHARSPRAPGPLTPAGKQMATAPTARNAGSADGRHGGGSASASARWSSPSSAADRGHVGRPGASGSASRRGAPRVKHALHARDAVDGRRRARSPPRDRPSTLADHELRPQTADHLETPPLWGSASRPRKLLRPAPGVKPVRDRAALASIPAAARCRAMSAGGRTAARCVLSATLTQSRAHPRASGAAAIAEAGARPGA
jgi:hypothetical protein